MPVPPTFTFLRFLRTEAAGGAMLCAAAVLALAIASSPLHDAFEALLQYRIGLSVHAWINDGLMAIFFLLVGLEIRREMSRGELSSRHRAMLPLAAAAGGMVVPALIYVAVNRHSPATLAGWGIPMATDIAFAMAALGLLGRRVPIGLKVFLVALAVADDIGAVLVIALVYTAGLSLPWLAAAALALAVAFGLNRAGVARLSAYGLAGLVLWLCLRNSGIHATIAGIGMAMVIPASPARPGEVSPALVLEHALQPWVAFAILPLFGLANAGVRLAGLQLGDLGDPLVLGIVLGLLVGKPVGIFTASWLAVRLGAARLPAGATWGMVFGVGLLGGIGFTMSLFIAALALHGPELADLSRLGVMAGSLLAAVLGCAVLYLTARVRPAPPARS